MKTHYKKQKAKLKIAKNYELSSSVYLITAKSVFLITNLRCLHFMTQDNRKKWFMLVTQFVIGEQLLVAILNP